MIILCLLMIIMHGILLRYKNIFAKIKCIEWTWLLTPNINSKKETPAEFCMNLAGVSL